MVISVGVTGASGFIGSSVLENFSKERNFKTTKIIRNNDSFLVSDHFDIIIHCAEISDRKVVNDMGDRYKAKALDSIECLICKCDYFIYLSSSVLYNSGTFEKKNENSEVDLTDNYCQIKSSAEELVIQSKGIALRLSNVYGEKMSKGNVISDILSQIGSRVMTLKNCHAVRDFIHVEDVSSYIKEIARKKCFTGVLNLGTGIGIKIKDLAFLANDLSGFSDIEVISKADYKLDSIVLDVDRLHELCSFRPDHNLKSFLLTRIGNQKC